MSLNGKKLVAAVRRGVADVRQTYRDMQREAEERAKRKIAKAKTKYEKELAKAQLEREKLALQREMYEVKAAVIREKEAVAKARRSAGILTLGEQLRSQAGQFSREFQGARRGLQKMQGGTSRRKKSSTKVTGTTGSTKKNTKRK